MACTPADLINDSRCYATLGIRQLLAGWAYLVCSAGPTPPGDNTRVTEDGQTRTTEDGQTRDTE